MSEPVATTVEEAAPSPSRADALASACAAVLVFAVCVAFTGPGSYWLDSSELTAAAFELGVPHPPGHPVYALTTRAAMYVPLGSVPFRAALASAAALAFAAALLVGVALALGRRVLRARGAAFAWLAVGVVAAACLSYGVAFQGVRAEVYALHLCLAAVVLRLVVHLALAAPGARAQTPREDDRGAEPPHGTAADGALDMRGFFLASLAWGLGLANHHWLAILGVTPLALALLWRGGRRAVAHLGVCAAAVFIGLGTYAYLPARAERAPVVSWGDPVHAERFAWVVSARAFQKSLKPREDASLASNLLTAAGVTMEAVTPLGLAGGLVGLVLVAWRRRFLGVGLLGAAGLTFASQLTMPADPMNPDVHGYLMLSMLLCAVGLCACAAWFIERTARSRVAAWLCGLFAIALPVAQTSLHAPRFSLRTFDAAEAVPRAALRALPVGSALFSSYFQSVFAWWHARVVEGERPDVALVDRHFLAYPGYAAREKERHPHLLGTVDAIRARDYAGLNESAARQPLFFELDLDLPAALARGAWTAPLFVRLGVDSATDADTRRARARAWSTVWRHAQGSDAEQETRRYFLWKHFVAATVALGAGHAGIAHDEARRGLALAPGSPELEALLARTRAQH